MKRSILSLFILCAILFTFNSCGITFMDGYDDYVEYTYYDYIEEIPIIYRGTVPYYVIWNDGYAYRRVPNNRYVYIRQYPEVHYYYRPYSYNRDIYPGGMYYDYYNRYYYSPQPIYNTPRTNNGIFGSNTKRPTYQHPQQNQSFGNMRRENIQNSPVNNNPSSSIPRPTYNGKFGGHR